VVTDSTAVTGPCIVCGSPKVHYRFSIGDFRVEQCSICKLMRLNPQPGDKQLGEIYGAQYFIMAGDGEAQHHASALKSNTAKDYLDLIAAYAGGPLQGDLLEIGCGHGDLILQAAERGLRVTGLEYSAHSAAVAAERLGDRGEVIVGEIASLADTGRSFDIIVFADVLEHVRDPRSFLHKVHALLKKEGLAVAIVPSLDSLSARLMGTSWVEFKPEHLWYFSTSNLRRLLHSESFSGLIAFPARKTLSFDYILGHFDHYPRQPFSSVLKFLKPLLPGSLRRHPVKVTASGIVMVARRAERHASRKLDVVMPAYNEAPTIAAGIERVLAKKIDGVDIELIIVESNSTDGTREIVRSFATREGVKVVLQDVPRGKGNAVRAGFAAVTGDYVLIQDADDEYDIEDYDALLQPLLSGEAAFVLGARHGGGGWKMRRFSGQPIVSHLLNFGHWFFATLLNLTYGLRLKDPFTMYKVFRADCLRGMSFECNRFDFDFELVIKLARRGYVPVEIPVNYRSRSFKEGKKVNLLRDPLSWLWAIMKFRFRSA
jgi:SAM-dependent methyltransferase